MAYLFKSSEYLLATGDVRPLRYSGILAESPSRGSLESNGALGDSPIEIIGDRYALGTYAVGSHVVLEAITINSAGELTTTTETVIQLDNGVTSGVIEEETAYLTEAELATQAADALATNAAISEANAASNYTEGYTEPAPIVEDGYVATTDTTSGGGGAVEESYTGGAVPEDGALYGPTLPVGTTYQETYSDGSSTTVVTYVYDGYNYVIADSTTYAGYT